MTHVELARTSPHSIEAERAALGSVFIKPIAFEDLSELSADDFFLPAHREILDAMRAIALRGREPSDVIMVAEELKASGMLERLDGGQSYLNDLANAVPTAENVRHYVRVIDEKATLRRLIATCAEVQSSAYGEHGDVSEFLAEARTKFAGVESRDQTGPTLIGDHVESTLASIELRGQSPDSYFVQTGIKRFDQEVMGLRGGNLIVVAGRPGGGKSAFAQDILLNASSRGLPSLLFSFEMTKMELTERAFAKRGDVNGHRIGTGRLSGPEWMRLHSASSKIADLPLWIDTRELTGPRICSEARRWFARQRVVAEAGGKQRKLGVVCIDYVGLVKSTGIEDTREREIAGISGALKRLAAELDIPVIMVSQLNRESVKAARPPVLSDLRESGSIEQDANMVVFPYWEKDPEPDCRRDDSGHQRHPAYLLVKKHRGGPMGDIPVDWQPEFVRFVDREDFVPEGPEQRDMWDR